MRLKTICLKRAQNIRLVFLARLWLNFRRQAIQGQQSHNFSFPESCFSLLSFAESKVTSRDYKYVRTVPMESSLWIISVHPVLIPTSTVASPVWCSGTLIINVSKTGLNNLKQHHHSVASLGLFLSALPPSIFLPFHCLRFCWNLNSDPLYFLSGILKRRRHILF